MHYLIDGYNFLFRIKTSKGTTLEEKRKFLIEYLCEELLSLKGRITIVFDSAKQIRDFPQSIALGVLEVLYAPRGKSADAYILELILQKQSPKSCIVVTSDGELLRQCRHAKAQTLTIEEFLLLLNKKKKRKSIVKPTYQETKKNLERLKKIFEDKLNQ